MIEVDDAGSGSLIGGTGIGIMRKETEEYIFKIIPLVFFREPNFSQKKYQEYVVKIIRTVFGKLNVSKKEPIIVCRGYVFDKLRDWLEHEGYNWKSEKIEGALQSMVEESFNKYVVELGLPKDFIQHARYAFGFHRLLKWVFADFENRVKYCKTGWKSWGKWSHVPVSVYSGLLDQSMYCLKCGNIIAVNEKATFFEYYTKKKWIVPVHENCSNYSLAKASLV